MAAVGVDRTADVDVKYYCDDNRHLICVPFSVANLHQMAKDLNIHRCWFHSGRNPHYDIPKLRIAEIKAKCEIVSSREILRLTKQTQPNEMVPWVCETAIVPKNE